MFNIQDIVSFVDGWRTANNTPTGQALTDSQLMQFQHELNLKVGQMSFAPPNPDSTLIVYSGDVLPDGTRAFDIVKLMSQTSEGTRYYISDTPVGQLLNDTTFTSSLDDMLGDTELRKRVLGNRLLDSTRTATPFGTELSLNDYVSRELVMRNASGNIISITGNSTLDSVFSQTEFKALMENSRVTSINGIPKSELQAIINSSHGSDDGFAAAREQVNLKSHLNFAYTDGYVVYRRDGSGNFDLDSLGNKKIDHFVSIDDTKITGGIFTEPATSTYDERINLGKQNGYLSVSDLKAKYSAWGAQYDALISKDTKISKLSAETSLKSLQLIDKAFSHNPTNPAAYFEENHPKLTAASNKIFDPKTLRMTGGSIKALGAVGAVFLVADIAVAYNQYHTLKQQGQDTQADKFMLNYSWKTATAFGSAALVTQLALPIMLGMAALGPVGVLGGFLLLAGAGWAGWTAGSFVGESASDTIWSLMTQAGSIPTRIDPLVLDLNGDGITTSTVENGIYYDLDNNGFAEKTGWINASDGILALDRDGNGVIEAGKELFGDRTILDDGTTASSGFAALATLDSNHDNIIDANDEKFADLRVWVDANQDGVSSPQELLTLAQAGVESINLTSTWHGQVDESGNTIAQTGTFTRTDGSTSAVNEYFLARDPSATIMTDWVDISDDIMELPDINSMGNTYSLRQAMARDTSGTLQELIEDFVADTSSSSRASKIDAILYAWTGASQIDSSSRGSAFDARKLAVLEKITGTSYRNSPVSRPTAVEVPILNMSYATFAERVYDMLSYQSHLRGAFSEIGYDFDFEEMAIKIEPAQVIAYLDSALLADPANGEVLLAEVTRILRTTDLINKADFEFVRQYYFKKSSHYQELIDTAPLTTISGSLSSDGLMGVIGVDTVITGKAGDDSIVGNTGNDILYGDEGADSIQGGAGDDRAYAGTGNDYIDGGSGNDSLFGQEEDDTLYGRSGNDLLDGGTGNDRLEGGLGNDAYVFGRDYGLDTIYDSDATENNVDTIKFLEGVAPSDVFVKRNGDNLELSITGTDDKLIVERYFNLYSNGGYYSQYVGELGNKIEQIQFADGTAWDINTVKEKARTTLGSDESEGIVGFNDQNDIIDGLAGDDSISTYAGDDSIDAGAGNDYVDAGYGDDELVGAAGDDILYARDGDDLLDGGAGTDRLEGSTGNDTYIFGRGYGVDTIYDSDATENNQDIIRFSEDITASDIFVKRNGDNLELSIIGTEDKLIVERYFSQYSNGGYYSQNVGELGNKIEQIQFADGTIWDIAAVKEKARVILGTDESNGLSGYYDQKNIIDGLGGDDSLYGQSDDDQLKGSAGNDDLHGQYGNDSLDGGTGTDRLEGGYGNDNYVFGLNYGTDTIYDSDATEGNIDKITFLEGVEPEDIFVKRNGDNLELSINGTEDRLIVERYFSLYSNGGYYSQNVGENGNKIEQIEFADGTVWDIAAVKEKARTTIGTDDAEGIVGFNDQDDIIEARSGDDSISTYNGDDSIDAGAGNDYVDAGYGNDELVGATGDDTLFARGGNDLLDGGTGNDRLEGDSGNDTYIFGRGYGVDTIYDSDSTENNLDVIQLSEDITTSDVFVKRNGDNLELSIIGTDDKLIVERYFSQYSNGGYYSQNVGELGNKIEQIQFADGTIWDIATVKEKARVILGTEDNNGLTGYYDQKNIIDGLGGDDSLYGQSDDDQLKGNVGNDDLHGQYGNDILDGGTGTDRLEGGYGNDDYVFGRNYGTDTIYDSDATEGNIDKITFLEGVEPTDIFVKRSGDNLELHITGTDDKLIVERYFSQYSNGGYYSQNVGELGNKIEQIQFADGTVWDVAMVKEKARTLVGTDAADGLYGFNDVDDIIDARAGDDSIATYDGNDTIDAGSGNDTADGGYGNDTIVGGSGDDTIYGGYGNDQLDGGIGNDVIEGNAGNDIYIFGRGYGVDTVYDSDTTEGNTDSIQFANDISPADISAKRIGDNLELSIVGADDKLIVERYFSQYGKGGGYYSYVGENANKIESFVFADGTLWSVDTIKEKVRTIIGTIADDYISGFSDQQNIIRAGEGNDTVYAAHLGDEISGEAGNDTIYGSSGNDLLDGGIGNDVAEGGAGNDTYVFGLGYGSDTIYDSDVTEGNSDIITLLEGVNPEDVTVTRVGNHLELSIAGTSDKLTVENYFSQYRKGGGYYSYVGENANKIEQIQFADGTVWDVATIKDKVRHINGTDNDEYIYGLNDQQNIISGKAGNDTVYAGSLGDTISGDEGQDAIYGSYGNDTIDGGTGNDILEGNTGSDTYVFGLGYGSDVIYDSDTTVGNSDIITLLEGINPADVSVKRTGDHLELSIIGTSDKLTVENYFSQYRKGGGYYSYVGENGNKIEQIQFADGTIWDVATIKDKARHIDGTDNDEYIYGLGDQQNIISGKAGNDVIYGSSLGDSLSGDEGNDSIFGSYSSDTINGGVGNDILEGGQGNDIYLFGAGFGIDTIYDSDATAGNVDVVTFLEGIAPSDVIAKRVGDNLELTIAGTDDKLTVERYFSAYPRYGYYSVGENGNKVEEFRFADGTVWDIATIKEKVRHITGTENDDSLSGFYDQKNIIAAGAGNDTIYASYQGDNIAGEAGNDTIHGSSGNDTLDGGTGDDILEGSYGNDTYVFGRGYGSDAIYDSDSTTGNTDVVTFLEDVAPSDVTVKRNGDNLELTIAGTSDKLTIERYFSAYPRYGYYSVGENGNKIEQFQFSDGTVWSIADIKEMSKYITGTENDDYLSGFSDQKNVITAGAGNDTIYASYQGDEISGEAGNDTIHGSSGADRLIGGTGNDTIDGATGNDSYVFALGDGQDVIYDNDNGQSNGLDVIEFGEGINASDVTARRLQNDDLELTIAGTSDKLTIERYFSAYYKNSSWNTGVNSNKIEELRFADGTVWDIAAIKDKVRYISGTGDADSISGFYDQKNIITGNAGDDTIYAASLGDEIYGGNGNDNLNGSSGDDLLVGGTGNDRLEGSTGNDTYIFALGDGQDVIYDTSQGQSGIVDVVSFSEDISPANVSVKRLTNDDLELTNAGTSDKLTIERFFSAYYKNSSWYTGANSNTVEEFRFADGTVWDIATIKDKARYLTGTESADSISGFGDQQNIIAGGAGDDNIYAGSGLDNSLYGDSGNDNIYGSSGNDRLDGGTGNDRLEGSVGNDTYVFGLGSGTDVIYDSDNGSGTSLDIVEFTAGVSPTDLKAKRLSNGDLELTIDGTSDTLTIERFFSNYYKNSSWYTGATSNAVEQFHFDDGTIWGIADIKNLVRTVDGTEAGESLYGYEDGDTITALGGNDYVYASSGNDALYGGAGDDYLYGESENDLLDGGTGNDHLDGGAGNDTYVFSAGYGSDTIYDYSGDDDKVLLGQDISNLVFSYSGNDLKIAMNGTDDSLTVSSWNYNSAYQIETLQAADGSTLANTQVTQLIQAMASFSSDNNGMSWSQALQDRPGDVQAILAQHWTAPTA